jgi:hypothetical protein
MNLILIALTGMLIILGIRIPQKPTSFVHLYTVSKRRI